MERLRSSWFALMGGVLLVTLSFSVAFGAGPAATLDSPPGESIAEFVHGLIFSSHDDPENEPETADHEDVDADEHEDEDGSHGECVSEVARSDEVGGPNDNHGGAVSEAARETCRETDDEESVADEEPIEEEEPVVEENGDEDDSHGACVSAAAQDKEGSAESDDRNHGAWVSKHARFICRGLEPPNGDATADEDADTAELTDKEERKAQRAAARAERKAEQAAAKAEKRRGGNGRGGGRP